MRQIEYFVLMLDEQAFFDVLSDETRRRILGLIIKEEELCVCELFFALDMHQPKVSRHLAVMRDAEVLTMRKKGTWVYYRLQPQLPMWALKVLEMMVQGVASVPVYYHDVERLSAMSNRPMKCCA